MQLLQRDRERASARARARERERDRERENHLAPGCPGFHGIEVIRPYVKEMNKQYVKEMNKQNKKTEAIRPYQEHDLTKKNSTM